MPARLLALLLLLAPIEAVAQLVPLAEGGARSLALGRATTALGGEVWGLHNPAAWAELDRPEVGVFVSQAHGMSELRTASAAVAYPTAFGTPTLAARTHGFEDFRETVLGIGFGRSVPLSATRNLHAGAALRATTVSIPTFGSATALGLSLGVIAEVVPGVHLGAHALNLNRPQLSDADPLETRLDAGLAWTAHPRARLLLAASKDADFPLSLRGGVEVLPVEALALRAGFATEPTRFSAGVGWRFAMIRADVAVELHEVLGMTPAFEVGVRW